MTTRRINRNLAFAFASAATLLFAPVLAAQRTAEEPQVIFHVQMVQADQTAAGKVAAERVTESKADFNSSSMIGVHILKDTTDATSLVAGETSRNTAELLGTPTLVTLNGEEARYLVGARKPVPTVEDLLSAEEKSAPAPDGLELSERDFGLKLDLGKIGDRLRLLRE